eukprot:CAMPEP_0198568682 /NCGR_PEP_ID=MMETSP1462-20131121/106799_1 /TAXON_ID=1333877 /ORGANISM="Brandtodinium nutriculum, Strain RCC3387" /LENGTH=142 /DNA_ID=CAMNT_0044299753 /DNA_START=1 /DNA_END=426 /DNA_ORIENTATION=+
MDRASATHQRIMAEEAQETPWFTPNWVFTVMLLTPYFACTMSLALHIFVNLMYSTKFARQEETHWQRASLIGLGLDLLLLDVIRCAVTAIVELRRFEIRRRSASGDFLKSRIRNQAGAAKEPELKQKKPPPKKPAVPKHAPK